MPDQDAADLKFRAGGVDAIDDVKPENYQWYEENQQKGNFTLYDLGASQATHLMWFNLNKVQPPIGGAKPTHGKRLGEPFVDPVKYEWFNNRDFRRAISMAIDRDAIIKSAFFGYGEKNWSQSTSTNKVWHSPDLIKHDYNPSEAKKLLAGMGCKDTNGDGVPRGRARQSGELHAEDQQQQRAARQHGELHPRRPRQDRRQDDADADRLQHADHEPASRTFSTTPCCSGCRAACRRRRSAGQNVWRSSGESHFWFIRQQKPATPRRGAHRPRAR